MTPVQKLAGLVLIILVLMAGAAGVTWQVQDWRMGEKLAEQAGLHKDDLAAMRNAAAAQARGLSSAAKPTPAARRKSRRSMSINRRPVRRSRRTGRAPPTVWSRTIP